MKKNFKPWSLGDSFDAIRIGEFEWTSQPGTRGRGVLAQELVEVFPDAVTAGDSDDDERVGVRWSVDYGRLTIPIIPEVQSLRARVLGLEETVVGLRSELAELRGDA